MNCGAGRRIVASFFLGVGVLTIGLLIAEAAMRGVRPDLIPAHKLRSIPDPFIGWRFEPGQDFHGVSEYGDPLHVKINRLGFPDVEHEWMPSPGVERAVILGDSFTAGIGVDAPASFVSVARKELARMAPDRKFELLKFGIPGFGTGNEYLMWKHDAAPFHPQTVFLIFFMGNDVANQLPCFPRGGMSSPGFELRDGTLYALPFQPGFASEKVSLWKRILDASALYRGYRMAERNVRTRLGFRHGRKGKAEGESNLPFWKRNGVPMEWQTYQSDHDAEFENAWRVTEALLIQLRKEVENSGASFVVVLLPGMESLDPNLLSDGLRRYPGSEAFSFDVNYPRRRLGQFLDAQKMRCVDMTSILEEQVSKLGLFQIYYRFDQHFAPGGHRIIGETLARYLLQNSKNGISGPVGSGK